ncbi:MAG: UrcA family protein [Sphingomonadales bacterium]
MIRILTVVAAMALAAHVAPAQAASVAVSYADLDMSSAGGHAQLEARIAAAARRVCRVTDNRNLGEVMAANGCYRDAVAATKPQLAALISAKTRAAG